MSDYTFNTVELVVRPSNAELIERQLAALGAHHAWITRTQLRALRSQLDRASDLAAMEQAVASVPNLQLRALRPTVSRGRPPQSFTDAARGAALREVAALESNVATAERMVVAELLTRTLRTLDFHVAGVHGASTTAIEARRGHAVILAEVGEGGGLELDTAGHEGDECEAVVAQLIDGLHQVGLTVKATRRDRHGRRAGGALIDRAARSAAGGSLAEGLIASSELPLRPTKPAAPVHGEAGRQQPLTIRQGLR